MWAVGCILAELLLRVSDFDISLTNRKIMALNLTKICMFNCTNPNDVFFSFSDFSLRFLFYLAVLIWISLAKYLKLLAPHQKIPGQ